MATERHELHCHACDKYVRFNMDLSVDGNYKIDCPNCGHDHYRVVRNGKVTDNRWGQSASQQWVSLPGTFYMNTMTATSTSGNSFLADSWSNTTTSSW